MYADGIVTVRRLMCGLRISVVLIEVSFDSWGWEEVGWMGGS